MFTDFARYLGLLLLKEAYIYLRDKLRKKDKVTPPN